MSHYEAKEKFFNICLNNKNMQGYYAAYLLFKLCQIDGKPAKALRESLIVELSKDAFSQKGVDYVFSTIVVSSMSSGLSHNSV